MATRAFGLRRLSALMRQIDVRPSPVESGDSKVALVTGGGTGVGKAAALALAKDGWVVVLAARNADNLQAAQKEIVGAHPSTKCITVPTDMTDPDAIAALFKRVKDECGRLDLLFNNAGTGAPPVPLEDLPLKQWKRVVDTNLTGSFLCAQEAFKIMKAQSPMGGRIINNGSISADRPRPNSAPYTSTKHAMTGLTKSLSLDGRKYDIAAGQIDIGNALTPMTQGMAKGVPQPNGTTLKEPTMDVANVGKAIAYMASLSLDANVLFMNVMATKMPYVGRG